MALFHFIGLDKEGALQTRLHVRPEHLEYAKGYVRLGGPILDEHGQPMGSVMIIEAENIEAAKTKLDHDPYTKAGLFENIWLRPWRVAIGAIQGYEG
jgi:uncharacterized protein YciI